MYRLAYRHFADHEALVVSHSVAEGKGVAIRWYELRNPQGTPTIEEQSTYAPDKLYRWIGSLAMDKMGDILMGYSVASDSVYPSIRYTGRSAGDPPGTMAAERILVNGKGSQQGLSRWGDYSSIAIDPTDDCTFWFTTQYLNDTGSYNWQTAIARLHFETCK